MIAQTLEVTDFYVGLDEENETFLRLGYCYEQSFSHCR